MNVYKTLRSRLARLLNVLCTFNLRPVSTGKGQLSKTIMQRAAVSKGQFTQDCCPSNIGLKKKIFRVFA